MEGSHLADQARIDAERASDLVAKSLKRRYAAEKRFRAYGVVAVAIAMAMLVVLFYTIISSGYPAFQQTKLQLDITLYPQDIDPEGTRDPAALQSANYRGIVRQAVRDLFPEVTSRRDKRQLTKIISGGAAFTLRNMVLDNPDLIGQRVSVLVPMSDDMDMLNKGVILSLIHI